MGISGFLVRLVFVGVLRIMARLIAFDVLPNLAP